MLQADLDDARAELTDARSELELTRDDLEKTRADLEDAKVKVQDIKKKTDADLKLADIKIMHTVVCFYCWLCGLNILRRNSHFISVCSSLVRIAVVVVVQ